MKCVYKIYFVDILTLFYQTFLWPQYTNIFSFSKSDLKLAILVTFWNYQRQKKSKCPRVGLLQMLLNGCCSVLFHVDTDCPLSQVTAIWGHSECLSAEDHPSQLDLLTVYLTPPPQPEHPRLPDNWQLCSWPEGGVRAYYIDWGRRLGGTFISVATAQ